MALAHVQVQFVGLSVPTCQPIAVTIIESNGAKSTPPYYMIAYPLEGTPRTYPLGETKDKLQWQMDYEAGMLSASYTCYAQGLRNALCTYRHAASITSGGFRGGVS